MGKTIHSDMREKLRLGTELTRRVVTVEACANLYQVLLFDFQLLCANDFSLALSNPTQCP